MEFCNGNYVALLAAPERLFASSDAKRARLHKLVVAACLDSLVNEFRRDVLERGQPWQEWHQAVLHHATRDGHWMTLGEYTERKEKMKGKLK